MTLTLEAVDALASTLDDMRKALVQGHALRALGAGQSVAREADDVAAGVLMLRMAVKKAGMLP